MPTSINLDWSPALLDRRPDAPPLAQRTSLGEAVTPGGRRVWLLRG